LQLTLQGGKKAFPRLGAMQKMNIKIEAEKHKI
jgi:hypothetical protein